MAIGMFMAVVSLPTTSMEEQGSGEGMKKDPSDGFVVDRKDQESGGGGWTKDDSKANIPKFME